MTSIELLQGLEFCAGWSEGDLRAVASLGAERQFEADSLLLRQGEPAAEAFAIAEGTVAVLRALPGGGELALAEKGPGSLVGEMGLLAEQRRSATARALGRVRSVVFDRQVFAAACRMRQPAARRLLLAVMERACVPVRVTQEHLAQALPAADAVRPTTNASPPEHFDYRGFLPLLHCAPALGRTGLDELAARASALVLARGETLVEPGAPPAGVWLVVRGALESVASGRPEAATLEVLGPGSFAGLPSALDGLPAGAGVRARENALVLHVPQAEFDAVCAGHDDFAFGLLQAIAGQLAHSLPRLSNRLAQHTGLRRSQGILARV